MKDFWAAFAPCLARRHTDTGKSRRGKITVLFLKDIFFLRLICAAFLLSFAVPPNGELATSKTPSTAWEQAVRSRASQRAAAHQESRLMLKFMANVSALSKQENLIFLHSGTMHLLALSGGQLGFLWIFIKKLREIAGFSIRKKSILLWRLWVGSVSKIIKSSMGVLIFVGCGQTGSLLRVCVIEPIITSRWGQKWCDFCARGRSAEFFALVRDFGLRGIVFLLLRNLCPTWGLSLSFVLSALGAEVLCFWGQTVEKRFLVYKNSIILKELITIVLTCLTMTLLQWPFLPINPFWCLVANLLCGPLCAWVITPMGLIILALPLSLNEGLFLGEAFDSSLIVFRSIAQFCSHHAAQQTVTSTLHPAFSEMSLWYRLCLCLLWARQRP